MTGTAARLERWLVSDEAEEVLRSLYGPDALDAERTSWRQAIAGFQETFRQERKAELTLISAPGRTELAGNHTDHNGGIVLAASVHLDTKAVVAPREDSLVRLHSAGFPTPFEVDLADLEPHEEEEGSPAALIRGVGHALDVEGYRIGGFDAFVASSVPVGSGLSSSASFEVLVAEVHNTLWNGGSIAVVPLCRAAQLAENRFFGKPCGLMDQIACANGGIVRIDFQNAESPEVRSVSFDFASRGYVLSVVNTGSSHADLTSDYASVPEEMKLVARLLGAERLRDTREEQIIARLPALRAEAGDRAILRALHFHRENERVREISRALEADDMPRYLAGVRASASSSWRLLQNYLPTATTQEQAIALTAALTERRVPDAVARVHGGGFAGAVQVYVPEEQFSRFKSEMEGLFGRGNVVPLRIRNYAAGALDRIYPQSGAG